MVQLLEALKEFGSDVRVIFVSYADATKQLQRMWIENWNEQYCSSSSSSTKRMMVLDPTRSAYQSFEITSSLLAGWGLKNIWYYFKAIISGRTRTIQIQGEAGQLGADFVIGKDGICVLAHYCRDPTDRVSVDKIVNALKRSC